MSVAGLQVGIVVINTRRCNMDDDSGVQRHARRPPRAPGGGIGIEP